jgi:hypothetical protein
MPAGKTGREITMNIRMAAVAACALTLGVTPAAADLFTFETTFTASSNVVQVGETVILDLKITLVPDLAADAAAGVIVFGIVRPAILTIYDDFSVLFGGGPPHSRDFILQLSAGYPTPLPPTEFTFAVSYDTPGVYSPTFLSQGELSIGEPIRHVGFSLFGTTSVSVVPGPIAGVGLPGLVLAFGSVATWWRRRRYPQRVQLVPL